MKDDPRNSLTNYLQAVLRKDYSSESLQTPEQKSTCARFLIQKAIDHDIELGQSKSQEEYSKICNEAIERFLSNWTGKQHGQDTRGTTSLGHIANAIMNKLE